MSLLRYLKATGQIVGVYDATLPEMLDAQQAEADPCWGFLDVNEPFPVQEQERWEVYEGRVQARQEVVLQATPTPFAADGATICTITRTPCIACFLLIANQVVPLAETDEHLTLTADAPHRLVIRLAPLAGYWAQPLLIEAVEEAQDAPS